MSQVIPTTSVTWLHVSNLSSTTYPEFSTLSSRNPIIFIVWDVLFQLGSNSWSRSCSWQCVRPRDSSFPASGKSIRGWGLFESGQRNLCIKLTLESKPTIWSRWKGRWGETATSSREWRKFHYTGGITGRGRLRGINIRHIAQTSPEHPSEDARKYSLVCVQSFPLHEEELISDEGLLWLMELTATPLVFRQRIVSEALPRTSGFVSFTSSPF